MRRWYWKLLVNLAGVACLTAILGFTVFAEEPVLKLISTPTGAPEALKEAIAQFEAEAGVKVEILTMPYHSLREKVTITLQGDLSAYDVIVTPGEWLAGWVEAGYLAPVEEMGVVDKSDFLKVSLDLFTYNAKLYAIPYYSNVQVVFYRRDLFEERGLVMPTEWEEFAKVAQKLTLDMNGDGKVDIYGAMIPGAPTGHLASEFTQMVWSFGGEIIDEKGCPIFDGETGLKALKFLKSLCYDYKVVPPWFLEMRVDTAQEDFMRGILATTYHYPSFVPIVSNPEKSLVHDKWAVTSRPGISLGSGWGFGISEGSRFKEKAFQLVQHILSPENMKNILIKSGLLVSRPSILSSDEVIGRSPLVSTFYGALLRSKPYPPANIPEWAQVESILYTEVNKALAEVKTVEESLTDAKVQVLEVLKSSTQ